MPKGDRGGLGEGATVTGLGALGRHRRRVNRVTGAEEHQEVVGKGEEEGQTHGVKNPPGEIE